MLNWLKKTFRDFRIKQRISREIDPRTFRELAQELKELADVAERLCPSQHEQYSHIQRIRSEMEQLDALASKPEFKKLSMQKRIQLRQSIIQSREQLIETVQTAPSPTATLQ